MKKVYALILALVLMFSMSMTVFAEISPSGTTIEKEEGDHAPKTGEMNLLFVELAGAALGVTAVVAAKKSKKEA